MAEGISGNLEELPEEEIQLPEEGIGHLEKWIWHQEKGYHHGILETIKMEVMEEIIRLEETVFQTDQRP